MLASLKIQKSQLSDENFIWLVTKDKMSTVSTWIFHMVIWIVGLKIRYVVKCFLTKDETSTWAETKSFKIIQVLIDPETTLIWYFGVRVKLRLFGVYIYHLWRTSHKMQATGSNFKQNQDFCRNHSFKYFSNLKDWWRLSVLIFEWRHKAAQFSAVLSWTTENLVHAPTSPLSCVNWAKSCVKNS